jgi:hypothetical protein
VTEQHHHDRPHSNGYEPLGLEASLDPSLLDPRPPSKRTRFREHTASNGRGAHLTTRARSDLPRHQEKQAPPSTSREPVFQATTKGKPLETALETSQPDQHKASKTAGPSPTKAAVEARHRSKVGQQAAVTRPSSTALQHEASELQNPAFGSG